MSAPQLGAVAIRDALGVRRRRRRRRRSHLRQRAHRRARPGTRPAGGARRRHPRSGSRADHQQGLRLGIEGRHARRAGDQRRRREDRRRGRPGIDVERALPAARCAHRLAPRQPGSGRLAAARRPARRLPRLPHGRARRDRRRALWSRARLDALALESHAKAARAEDAGLFDDEIVAVEVAQPGGRGSVLVAHDEGIRRDASPRRSASSAPPSARTGSSPRAMRRSSPTARARWW